MKEALRDEIFSVYAAVTDDDLWRSVLWRTCGHLGAAGMALIFGDETSASAIASGLPEAEIAALKALLPTRAPAQLGQLNDSRTCGTQYWLLPGTSTVAGPSGHHLLVQLDHDDETVGYADLYRERGAPDFDVATVDSFVMLAPHLAQGLALALRLAKAETSIRRCAQCSDMLPFGCVLLDEGGSIIEMNHAASEMVTSSDGLMVTDNRLRAVRAVDDAALSRRLSEVLGDGLVTGTAFFSVPRPSGRRHYGVFMRRMSTSRSAFASRVPRVRLVIVDTDQDNYVPREVVRTLYGLTETESRVVWHLAGGDTVEQTAEGLGIAQNTLRHHVERIFAKTGVHRQSDLIRLVQAPFVSISGMT